MRRILTLCPLLLCCEPCTQSLIVPNANATARGNGSLNVLHPLQTNMLGISAAELAALPIGTPIQGFSFRVGGASNAVAWPAVDESYTMFDITIGYALPPTSWTTTFLNNFIATPLPPLQVRTGPMVLDAGTYPVVGTLPTGQPQPFGAFFFDFKKPFVYLGGDLAILFAHNRPVQTNTPLMEQVSPAPAGRAVYIGATTSPATTSSGSYGFPVVRLHYGYGFGCAGTGGMVPNLVLTNSTTGGGPATFSLANAPANAVAAYAFGVTRASFTMPNGCAVLTTPLVTVPVTLNTKGRFLLTLTVPASALGLVETQGFLLDAGAPGGFTTTNGVTLSAK